MQCLGYNSLDGLQPVAGGRWPLCCPKRPESALWGPEPATNGPKQPKTVPGSRVRHHPTPNTRPIPVGRLVGTRGTGVHQGSETE